MALFQLTEYLLWKSIKKKPTSISTTLGNNIKQESYKHEIFDNDMICRVCTDPADIPITKKIGNTLIITAIRMIANISITEGDCFPKYVCQKCLEELKTAFQFKKKCEASDMAFQKAISNATISSSISQPFVKHDFSLLLHQMEQKRLAQQAAIKNDDSSHDFSDDDIPDSSTSYCNPEPAPTIDVMPKKNKEAKIINNTIPSTLDIDTQNRIVSILQKCSDRNDDQNDKTDINLKKHSEEKKTKQLKKTKCRRCDQKFDTKEGLQKHQKENSCIYHACPLCRKLVLNLASHERIVHSRPHKYTCHKCGKMYYSSGALINHMHRHTDTKEYHCDHCPYRGKRKSYLVCHMRVHTGERRYLCSICPLKFTNISNLKKHQLVHYDKKFECSKCKRLFRNKKQLNEHFEAIHLNIRYRCTICGRDLRSRKKLLNHELKIHKREKNKLFDEVQTVVIGNDDG